eukprot:COSAG02_NODE_512_length_20850_cov_4.993302_13_plen_105_part_00
MAIDSDVMAATSTHIAVSVSIIRPRSSVHGVWRRVGALYRDFSRKRIPPGALMHRDAPGVVGVLRVCRARFARCMRVYPVYPACTIHSTCVHVWTARIEIDAVG